MASPETLIALFPCVCSQSLFHYGHRFQIAEMFNTDSMIGSAHCEQISPKGLAFTQEQQVMPANIN